MTICRGTVGQFFRYVPPMTISSQQAIITIQGTSMKRASEMLVDALKPYANARVTSLVQSTSYMTSWRGHVTLLAIIDHD